MYKNSNVQFEGQSIISIYFGKYTYGFPYDKFQGQNTIIKCSNKSISRSWIVQYSNFSWNDSCLNFFFYESWKKLTKRLNSSKKQAQLAFYPYSLTCCSFLPKKNDQQKCEICRILESVREFCKKIGCWLRVCGAIACNSFLSKLVEFKHMVGILFILYWVADIEGSKNYRLNFLKICNYINIFNYPR